jgi:UDP-N-acetylglucosamine 2-epimerase (non-hydrolysing)
MGELSVATIIGTRPEIIRLSEVIKALDENFAHVLIHTGQNYDYSLNKVFFEDLELREPDYYLNSVGANLGETIGNIIAKSYETLEKIKPDALLVLGDTNSALCAIAAKRLKIPVFHMEAGNRCFDENVPEEINRKIVDHISDINLPYTEHSRRYLLSEGFRKEHIFVTGSPMKEVLTVNMGKIKKSKALEKFSLEPRKYILLSAHREENIDIEANFGSLMNAINEIADKYKMPVIYSTHPRSRKIISSRGFVFNEKVKCIEPQGFIDYNRLQMDAYCVLSDSGTLSEESHILGFPAVLLRTSTERPEAIEKGPIIIGGISAIDIYQAIELAVNLWDKEKVNMPIVDYMDTEVSSKVVRIIQSYTKIVNKVIWRKN